MMKDWKRFLSIGLVVALVVSMCGCSKKGNDSDGYVGKQTSASPELAKQYVYRMDPFDFSKLQVGDGDISVQGFKKIRDKLYAVLQKYNYMEDGSFSNEILIAEISPDGKSVENILLDMPVEDRDDGGEAASAEGDQKPDVYENVNYGSFHMSDNGYIYGCRTYDYSDYSDPDNYVNEHRESVCCWNMEGQLQWNAPLDGISTPETWYYVNALVGQKDGSVIVLLGGSEYGFIKVSKDGTVGELTSAGNIQEMLETYSGLTVMPDGKLLVSYYDSGWQNMYVNTYDFSTDQAGEAAKIPASVAGNLSGRAAVDEKGALLYSTASGVYRYEIGAESEETVMSFVNSDLYITGFDAIISLDDNSFAAIYSEYDSATYNRSLQGGIFSKVDAADIPDKKVLVLGGAYLYGDLQKRVIDYNKSNSEYKIVMKDYSQYNTYEDYSACYTKLNNDIISGQMPDILVVDAYNLSLEKYANKGLLADIGEMIQNDDELSKIDYMQNVFDACKLNNKLYEVIPSFTVQGYIAKKSLVGDRNVWTMQEAISLLNSLPADTNLFSDMTKNQFVTMMMQMCGTQFVDVSTGKCNFDTPQFRDYMEYAKRLPDAFDDDYYNDALYKVRYESQYRNGYTVLANAYISDVSDLVYSINGAFGEEVAFVGFPGTDNATPGSVINTNTSYALAAHSANLEAAWQFVRYYLTDEYQDTVSYQLPVKKAALEKNAQKAMKKPSYMMDGKEIEEDYRYWINDEQVTIEPLTQAQVDEIVKFISSVSRRAYYNTAVNNIIGEELGAYFKNQKSAEDVSKLIQNRVQLYINENK
ncbi:MAG: extracellular solute-binding protein [Lachnospiraceae bacterium]|nr:extracellular solute-binding protein [Lachnospiraceae bacterium]